MRSDVSLDPSVSESRDYRAITFSRDGLVTDVRSVIAWGDEEAIAQTAAMACGFAMDLWDGLRFVEHFSARLVIPGGMLAPVMGIGRL